MSQGERISRDTATLLSLGQDDAMHGRARADHQWLEVHAAVMRTLPLAAQQPSDLQAGFTGLRETAQGLPELFDALERASLDTERAAAQPRQDERAKRLQAATGRAGDAAFELSGKLLDRRQARDLGERRATLATMAAARCRC